MSEVAFQLFKKFVFIYWSTNNIIHYIGQITTYGFSGLFHRIEIIFNIFDEVILITIFTLIINSTPLCIGYVRLSTSLSIG